MATMVQAIRLALHVGEERLGVTDMFGEDVGPPLGGVFTQYAGPARPRGTRRSTSAASSARPSASRSPGQRPVAEIQFCDYAFNTIDLLKLAGGMCWSSAGDWQLPDGADDARRQRHPRQHLPLALVRRAGDAHPGLEDRDAVATRSTPTACCSAAIIDPNPVMYLAPKALLRAKARPERAHPGEPDDERELSKMIDAPLGDRSRWRPRVAGRSKDCFVPIGKARTVPRGAAT